MAIALVDPRPLPLMVKYMSQKLLPASISAWLMTFRTVASASMAPVVMVTLPKLPPALLPPVLPLTIAMLLTLVFWTTLIFMFEEMPALRVWADPLPFPETDTLRFDPQ